MRPTEYRRSSASYDDSQNRNIYLRERDENRSRHTRTWGNEREYRRRRDDSRSDDDWRYSIEQDNERHIMSGALPSRTRSPSCDCSLCLDELVDHRSRGRPRSRTRARPIPTVSILKDTSRSTSRDGSRPLMPKRVSFSLGTNKPSDWKDEKYGGNRGRTEEVGASRRMPNTSREDVYATSDTDRRRPRSSRHRHTRVEAAPQQDFTDYLFDMLVDRYGRSSRR